MDPFIWLRAPCFNIFSVTKLLRTFVSEREYMHGGHYLFQYLQRREESE